MTPETSFIDLPVEDVYPNPKHYREVREADVKTLAASIAVVGQLEPITVFRDSEIYIVDSGHHRLSAVKSLGLDTIKAIVLDDIDDTRSAQVMVASNMHFPASDIENSRGTQLLLSTGVRPIDVAALVGESDTDKIERVKRGLAIAQDYAEDMTLERLAVLDEFEGDDKAIEKLMKAPEDKWRMVYRDLSDANLKAANLATAQEIVKASGVEVIEQQEYGKHHYLACGEEMPEGAKYARIVAYGWSTSVDINWYDDAEEQTESPEAAAKREQDELIAAELEKAAERRIAFIAEHLRGEGPSVVSNDLRDFAVSRFDAGASASVGNILPALNLIVGFVPRIYSSLLSSVERNACSALSDSQGWSAEHYGELTVTYFEALKGVGFEATDVENGALAEIAQVLDDPCNSCEDQECDECEHKESGDE